MLTRIALVALCDWWALEAQYLDELRRFALGVDWDVEGDVRQEAILLLGEYLRRHDDLALLHLLIGVAEDGGEPEVLREDAIRALARALGDGYETMPPAARREPLDSAWSIEVIRRARTRG